MNQQRVKQLRPYVFAWCGEKNIPHNMWTKAWRRFKKAYKNNPALRNKLRKHPWKTINDKFVVN